MFWPIPKYSLYVYHPYKRVHMSQYTKAVKTGHKAYNIPVFISIEQNYFTTFYVSKYCFASFSILFLKNLNYKQLFFS